MTSRSPPFRSRPWLAFIWVAGALLASPATAQEQVEHAGVVQASCSVLVMDLKGKALDEADAELPAVLTEALVAEVSRVSGCEVVSEADIASMMQLEASKVSCGGELDSCLAEIGAAFGAERALSGTVGRIGTDFQLTARLLDVNGGSIEARAEQTVKGGPDGLQLAAKNLGRALFEKELLPAATGDVDTAVEKEAEGGVSLPLLGGAALAGAGALLVAGGAAMTGAAEWRMSDATSTDKDEMQLLGLAAIVGTGAGALLGLGGGVLLVVGMME